MTAPEEASGTDTGTDDAPPPSKSAAAPSEGARIAEATVVGRAQDGDLAAFEHLVRQYQRPLFRLALRMLNDRAEAEDVLQDTMVAVWRKLPSLNDPVTFQAWIYQITTRRCLTILRSRTRRRTDPLDPDTFDDPSAEHPAGPGPGSSSYGADPAAAAEHRAQLQGLDTFLHTLPDEQRACWILRELHDLSYADIAYAMNLPVSTVRGRIARARQNLMEGMKPWR